MAIRSISSDVVLICYQGEPGEQYKDIPWNNLKTGTFYRGNKTNQQLLKMAGNLAALRMDRCKSKEKTNKVVC